MNFQQLCVLGLSLLLTSGCSDAPEDNGVANKTEAVAPGTGTQYLTSSEPAAVMEVADARKSAKADEAIAIVGRIGGSGEPFVDGVAAFTVVDLKIAHCSADEGCPTPWDYCCTQDQVKDNKVSFLAPEDPKADSSAITQTDQMFIPDSLVSDTDGQSYVWIVDGQQQARHVAIQRGHSTPDGLTHVISGLQVTDKLIASGVEQLADGINVKIRSEDQTLGLR